MEDTLDEFVHKSCINIFLVKLVESNQDAEYNLLVHFNNGSKIWGAAAKSNIRRIAVLTHKYLRTITGAPWYMTNHQLRLDYGVEPVSEIIKTSYPPIHQKIT